MNDDVGPYLSLAGVRSRFPRDPLDMSDGETRWELVRLGFRIAWAALRQDFPEVCVFMVRLRELVEEDQGKAFDHGDHWT